MARLPPAGIRGLALASCHSLCLLSLSACPLTFDPLLTCPQPESLFPALLFPGARPLSLPPLSGERTPRSQPLRARPRHRRCFPAFALGAALSGLPPPPRGEPGGAGKRSPSHTCARPPLRLSTVTPLAAFLFSRR